MGGLLVCALGFLGGLELGPEEEYQQYAKVGLNPCAI